MSLISRVFFIFISVLTLFVLFFFTFFLRTSVLVDYEVKSHPAWLYKLYINDWNIEETNIIEIWDNSWSGIYVDRLNIIDDFYVLNNDYVKNVDWRNVNIEIWSWEYIIDIKTITNSYSVTNKFFKLDLLWPWKFYFSTKDPENFVIFSLDSLGKLHLNANIWKKWTDMYLFPHMYLDFHTMYSFKSNNYDILKLKTTRQKNFNLWYFKDSLFSKGEINNNIFAIDNLLIETDFFKNVNNLTLIDYRQAKINFDLLQESKVSDFVGLNYINKYFWIFLNDSKKKIYYKNILLNEIISLLQSNEENVEDRINNIIKDLAFFEAYPIEYKEIIGIINMYYRTIALNNETKYINNKLNYYKLILKLDNYKDDISFKSIMLINFIYSYFDIKWKYSFDDLVLFVNDYIDSFQWEENNNYSYITDKSIYIDYLSFFLEQIFMSRFSLNENNLNYLSNKENIGNIVSLIESYLIISKGNYSKEQKIDTGFYIYIDILNVFDKFIKNWFFEDERNIWWILIPLKSINDNNILKLEEQLNSIFDFLELFKNRVSWKDIELVNRYEELKDNFEEYFYAIDDYERYKIDYDKDLWKLLDDWKDEKFTEEYLSRNLFLDFIRVYNWVNAADLKVDIIEDTYYRIKDLYINWSNFSFELYPDRKNMITNLKINHTLIQWNYVLWDSSSDKDILDWTNNYFIDKFLSEIEEKDIIIIDDSWKNIQNDDKIISVFKSNTLLWKNWHFSVVDSLALTYNDINVKRWDDWFNININWAKIYNKGNNSKDQYFVFTMDYVSDSNVEKRFFKNIKIKYRKNENNIFFLDGVPLNVIWKIKLNEFDVKIKEILINYDYLIPIYNDLYETLPIHNITYTFDLNKNKQNIKFDYNDKTIIVWMTWNIINTIYVSWKNIITKNTDYKNLKKYLNIIKKM